LPKWADRLLDSPALIRRVAKMSGKESPAMLGRLTVSTMMGEHGRQRREVRKLVDALAQSRPGLVNLPNAMFLQLARPIKDALGVPILCTLTGEDLFIDGLPEPYRSRVINLIRKLAPEADGFVALSRYYADYCIDQFGIAAAHLHVVPAGIRVDADERDERPADEPFTVGYMARICPEKGLHVLCDAVKLLRSEGRKAQLVVAGYLPPAQVAYLDQLKTKMRRDDGEDGLTHLGEVDRVGKLTMLRSLHAFCVPTTYRDPKGLFALEALAQGVPVIQPRHGVFPDLIEATGGGLLFEPGDTRALADAIAKLMDDRALRERLGRAGRQAVLESFTDQTMAKRMWAVYERYQNDQ
jgi:glycosyltransferase involved in cell wall biosynthesis